MHAVWMQHRIKKLLSFVSTFFNSSELIHPEHLNIISKHWCLPSHWYFFQSCLLRWYTAFWQFSDQLFLLSVSCLLPDYVSMQISSFLYYLNFLKRIWWSILSKAFQRKSSQALINLLVKFFWTLRLCETGLLIKKPCDYASVCKITVQICIRYKIEF